VSSGLKHAAYERWRQRWVDRAARRVFDRLTSNPASYRSAPSTVGATATAAVILASAIGFLGVLVWSTMRASGTGWVPVAAGWLVVVALRPRIPRLPRDAVVLDPSEYPGIHGLVRQMAAAVGVRAPRIVAVDVDFNAYVTPVGVPARWAVVLGLPLFTVLPWPARLAVLGHELGHLRDRDTRRGRLMAAASSTVAGVRYLLSPAAEDLGTASRDVALEDGIGFGAGLARGVQTVLAAPFLLLWLLLERLSLMARQHREYLADRTAASVVGSEALVDFLIEHLEGIETATAAAARRREDPFAHLQARPPLTSAQRAARLRELADVPHRSDETHPPDGLRIALLQAHPLPPGRGMPSETDRDLAEQELVALRAASAKEFSQALRFGRYH
jgi:Zn-dependent protease with chaperone function